jgi:sigma-B regulation protein RsbU (phosphoserine phosphatase)
MKVLIVEDEQTSLELLRKLITSWDYEVITASDGDEGWEKFQSEADIQIVVSDWIIPGIDGLKLCRNIRETSEHRYTYIIILSAKTEINDLVEGIEAGADDFVTKPFNNLELKARLKSGTRLVRLENELAHKIDELSAAYEQMKDDLEAASLLQKSMLPSENIQFEKIDYAWNFSPWDKVGGDLFNIVKFSEDKIGIYILDVAGHGVPAALLTVAMGRMLSPYNPDASLLKKINDEGKDSIVEPAQVARLLNSRFQFATSRGDFITFLYGVLDLNKMTFKYTRAGHPTPIHISNGEVMEIPDDGGIPIGIIPDYDYKEYEICVSRGDRLYLVTDGYYESVNPRGVRFSEKRTADILLRHHKTDISTGIAKLTEEVQLWHNNNISTDDMTIIGLEIF